MAAPHAADKQTYLGCADDCGHETPFSEDPFPVLLEQRSCFRPPPGLEELSPKRLGQPRVLASLGSVDLEDRAGILKLPTPVILSMPSPTIGSAISSGSMGAMDDSPSSRSEPPAHRVVTLPKQNLSGYIPGRVLQREAQAQTPQPKITRSTTSVSSAATPTDVPAPPIHCVFVGGSGKALQRQARGDAPQPKITRSTTSLSSAATPSDAPPPTPPAAFMLQLESNLEGPRIGTVGTMSLGSMYHHLGWCKPCDFTHRGACRAGVDCKFCHLCGPEDAKRRKKEKIKAIRAMGR
eukprot:TRINITY_DN39595_c0_g1_i1.p1 TRINITY_DN39595_c0_g1~~TRINITY_DN39595_c0_g1_i1.p1  ORF type:complete len:294 (-),score=37.77 TRINITY_DN39595_c0_g1_i1:79-960(-)